MRPIEIIASLLCSGLIGALLGGYIAGLGAVKSVFKMEEFRRSEKLRILFRAILVKLSRIGHPDTRVNHPASVIEDIEVDNAVSDFLSIVLCRKSKRSFESAWNQYRYDPKHHPFPPLEYAQMKTEDSTKLISDRIHGLISLLK